jgi:poly-beta-1,6-N-acetyl-D-glucosamine synthase
MARVICVIPAHNEATGIGETLASVAAQTRPVDQLIVVADNCTDATAAIAAEYGTVVTTVGNRDKKAGALNQAMNLLVPALADDDFILVMDADTTIPADFVETAERSLDADPLVGGVSSIFAGRSTSSVLGLMQSMEFFRYRRQILRNGNRAFVLSGTASAIRVSALRAIKAARGELLPDGGGDFYDTASLTEDNELTLALLMTGYRCVAPGAQSTTDVMPDVSKLYRQRHRWYLGALRNLREYGTRMPWHMRLVYWRQQIGLVLSVLTVVGMVFVWSAVPMDRTHVLTVWSIAALALLAIERVSGVWAMGWKPRLLALALVPEQLYSLLLLFTFGSAAKDFVLGRKGAWHAT